MAKKFPTTLFVKIETDSSVEYFTADASADALVEMNAKIAVAEYRLVGVSAAEGVAKFHPSRRNRS